MNEYPFSQPDEDLPVTPVPQEPEPFPTDPDPVPTEPEPLPSDPEPFPTEPEPLLTEPEPLPSDQESAGSQPHYDPFIEEQPEDMPGLFPEEPDSEDLGPSDLLPVEAPPEKDYVPAGEGAENALPEPDQYVSADYLFLDHGDLVSPELTDSISRDEDAYGFHGMTEPGEINEPFDLSILDDPDLDLAEASSENTEIQEYPEKSDGEDVYDDPELQEIMDASQESPEEPVQEPPARNHQVRKGRPRRKKGEGLLGIPNILVTIVWCAIVIAIGVTLGRMMWICAAEVLAFGRENTPVTVTIYETDTIDDITEKLYRANLVRYPELFKLYASFAVDEGEIHPGIWDLNTRYDYHALVKKMSPSTSRSVVKVTIPEGFTCRQIFELLQTSKVCTTNDIISYCSSGELDDYWFLEGVTRGDAYCLEGYLFPDTYEFYTNDSPKSILKKMLDNFDTRVANEENDLRNLLPGLNEHLAELMRDNGRDEEYVASHQLTMRDVLIVASLIEKETSGKDESPAIASVIYNRLFHWGDTPAYLNIDASIIYAHDGKTDLTAEDMKIDSPYNTYYNVGLTPGPIANPGLDSIRAALEPSSTDYYYYILDPAAGNHHFSTTLEEHEAFRASLSNG